MKIKDITKHELIGLEIEVTDSKNKANIGIKGEIIDETKSTLVIETKKGKKRVSKENIIIILKIGKQKVKVDGKLLHGRSKERVKL